ncbi:phosphatase PAP2 family protein [Paenibacillus xerothermodurans]|uniref:PAP2 family protein n=1 Tax=Paenibacillus xerothermodurans TaxID=1977292 RepID=A0A2W1NZI6_PAEXE|nr:phosphatase PAP2 family protein [Paenibacillus xerothermodurans]PZE20278.1 PAP2 family protein [Paenibacillus xerothermodurans]
MHRLVSWLQRSENRIFVWVNRRFYHKWSDWLLHRVTHLGGATTTIVIALGLAIFGQGHWRTTGFYCCLALLFSHIPVALLKRKYPRLRPYLVLPDTRTCPNPLTDHSFPSGHTTAIFSVVVPIVCTQALLAAALLPLAVVVAISRMYLGLHYPSDCAAGAAIGSGVAFAVMGVFE